MSLKFNHVKIQERWPHTSSNADVNNLSNMVFILVELHVDGTALSVPFMHAENLRNLLHQVHDVLSSAYALTMCTESEMTWDFGSLTKLHDRIPL